MIRRGARGQRWCYPRHVIRQVSLVTTLALMPAVVFAQPAPPTTAPTGPRPVASKDYVPQVVSAMRLAVAGDLANAKKAVQSAIASQPTLPRGYLVLASIMRLGEQYSDAVTMFQRCSEVASAANELYFEGACLRGVADTLEREPAKVRESLEAWRTYHAFARKHPDETTIDVANARMEAINNMVEQEMVYLDVRERIEVRRRKLKKRDRKKKRR